MCCSKSMVCRKWLPVSACGSRRPNCQSRLNLFHGISWLKDLSMKMAEIKDLTVTELLAKSRDLRQEMFHLRLQQASSQLEKPARLRDIRKDIARIETRISQVRNQPK